MDPIDRIRDFIRTRSRSTEVDTDSDGFLSYSGEWHGVAVGAIFGLCTAITGEPFVALVFALIAAGIGKRRSDHLRDAAKEVGYSGGAFVFAYAVGNVAGTL